jgi:hypothetical protein
MVQPQRGFIAHFLNLRARFVTSAQLVVWASNSSASMLAGMFEVFSEHRTPLSTIGVSTHYAMFAML